MKSKSMLIAAATVSIALLSQFTKAQEAYPPAGFGMPATGNYDPSFAGQQPMPGDQMMMPAAQAMPGYYDPAYANQFQHPQAQAGYPVAPVEYGAVQPVMHPGHTMNPGYSQPVDYGYQQPGVQQVPGFDPGYMTATAYADQYSLEPIAEGSPEEHVFMEGYGNQNCETCGVAPKVFGGVEYLYVWRKGQSFPGGILTTSTDPNDEGIIGQPTTSILFGGTEQDTPRSGIRLTMGIWLDEYQNWGFGGRGIALEQEVAGFNATTADFDTLAHPFFNTNTSLNDSFVISKPGNGANAADTASTSIRNESNFYTGDIFLTKHLWTKHANRFDFMTGYSYVQLDTNFNLNSVFTVQDLGGSIPTGTVVTVNDMFDARNDFHGGHFGVVAELQDGPFTWRFLSKIAIGQMNQDVTISGFTLEDAVQTDTQGVYARDTNSGSFSANRFAYIPEFNADVIYALTCNLDFKVGSTFIYVSDVVTPGSLIDPNIDPTAATNNPAFTFDNTDYWVLGMNFGVDFHY